LKVLGTAAFLGILTLADQISVPDQRHGRDYSGDVFLRNQLVSVEVVDLEGQKNFVIHRWAVKTEKSVQELLLVQVAILVEIQNFKKSLSDNSGQLAVIQKADFVDSLRFVVWAGGQVFVDVCEVGNADFGLELFGKLVFV